MIVAKQVADFITLSRALLGLLLVWLGITQGAEALPLAAWIMLADWGGDMVDGRIARRSRVQYHTWIGDHDLEVDMTVSVGLLIYMLAAGFVNIWVGAIYIVLWGLYFWRNGIPRSPGMLFQAPIYAWFIYALLRAVPVAGVAILVFMTLAIVVTWPYFPKVMVPGFLKGIWVVERKDKR
jgi:hypothetical protein